MQTGMTMFISDRSIRTEIQQNPPHESRMGMKQGRGTVGEPEIQIGSMLNQQLNLSSRAGGE